MMNEVWRGFDRLDFTWAGHDVILTQPRQAREGRPWIWRTEFFDAFAQVDEAMANDGYFVAYVRLSNRYGCPSAVEDMHAFYRMMIKWFGLSEKPLLFGFSRGGLYAVNFALAHPDCVGALYLDAPVLDMNSWPGGMDGKRPRSDALWQECLAVYGYTEAEAKARGASARDGAEALAKAGIPVCLVAGDSDAVVPYVENGEIFARQFEAAGGKMLLIVKPGCDHHPHSVENVRPVVEFLEGC